MRLGALRTASEWRSNKLTASEYDETTWSARSFMAFAAQRISVAVQLSMAQEVAEALGLSVADVSGFSSRTGTVARAPWPGR